MRGHESNTHFLCPPSLLLSFVSAPTPPTTTFTQLPTYWLTVWLKSNPREIEQKFYFLSFFDTFSVFWKAALAPPPPTRNICTQQETRLSQPGRRTFEKQKSIGNGLRGNFNWRIFSFCLFGITIMIRHLPQSPSDVIVLANCRFLAALHVQFEPILSWFPSSIKQQLNRLRNWLSSKNSLRLPCVSVWKTFFSPPLLLLLQQWMMEQGRGRGEKWRTPWAEHWLDELKINNPSTVLGVLVLSSLCLAPSLVTWSPLYSSSAPSHLPFLEHFKRNTPIHTLTQSPSLSHSNDHFPVPINTIRTFSATKKDWIFTSSQRAKCRFPPFWAELWSLCAWSPPDFSPQTVTTREYLNSAVRVSFTEPKDARDPRNI